MNPKDFLLDKTVKVGKGTVESAKIGLSTIENVAQTAYTNAESIIVNHTPDFYDEGQDATRMTIFAAANTIMVKRNINRMARSTANLYQKKRLSGYESDIAKIQANLDRDIKYYGNQKDKLSASQLKKLKQRIKAQENQIAEMKISASKVQKRIKPHKGFSIRNSTKATISNQSRKLIATIGSQDDLGSKVIGKSAKVGWGLWKYRRSMQQVLVKSVAITKTAMTGLITVITSIPSLIIMICTSIPLMILLLIVVLVSCLFSNLEYSGRVITLSENEVKLENAYQTAILPDEILALSQTLGWTTQNIEDYEILISLAYDQQRGSKPTFDEMMDNVFSKYNPANHFSVSSPIDYEGDSGIAYYHNDEAKLTNLWNSSVKKQNMTNSQWLNVYPQYRDGNSDKKREMSSESFINEMKEKCYSVLEQNGYNNVGTFLAIDDTPNIFTSYLLEAEVASVSSAVGYRTIILNDTERTSFHAGEDIPAPKGTPVYAPLTGTVIYADGSQTIEGTATGLWGAGNSVLIRQEVHNAKGDLAYLYVFLGHLEPDSVTVRKGQIVESGSQVGAVGTTGTSTGYHIHFQVWISSNKLESVSDSDYVAVRPNSYTDSETADTYSVDNDDYTIYLDGLMFYDVEYRNKLLNR